MQQMLDRGDSVVAVVRSKQRMMSLLDSKEGGYGDRLVLHENNLLDLSHEDLKSMTKDCSAVVSCLGHNLTFKGIYGKASRYLVTKATMRLTAAMPASSKFILMGSEGVAHPDDDPRSFGDRVILALVRLLLPPHNDNEAAAAFLYENEKYDWTICRPTNLIDVDQASGRYDILAKPPGKLISANAVSRANVAHFMVKLMTDDQTFETYKHKTPVINTPPKE